MKISNKLLSIFTILFVSLIALITIGKILEYLNILDLNCIFIIGVILLFVVIVMSETYNQNKILSEQVSELDDRLLEQSLQSIDLKEKIEELSKVKNQDGTKEEKKNRSTVQLLTEYVLELELKLENRHSLENEEIENINTKYQAVTDELMSLIMIEAKKLQYPTNIQEWSDFQPLKMINIMSMNQLMNTNFYQNIMINRFIK